MRDSMQQAASNFESSVKSEMDKTESDLNKAIDAASVDDAVADKKPEESKPVA